MIPLDFTQKNELQYDVEASGAKYTVFTLPQRYNTDGWTYNGHSELKNLGLCRRSFRVIVAGTSSSAVSIKLCCQDTLLVSSHYIMIVCSSLKVEKVIFRTLLLLKHVDRDENNS